MKPSGLSEPDWFALAGWQPSQARLVFTTCSGQHALAVLQTRSAPSILGLAVYSKLPDNGWTLVADGDDIDRSSYFGWTPHCVFGVGMARPGASIAVRYRGINYEVQAAASGWWSLLLDTDPAAGDLVTPALAET